METSQARPAVKHDNFVVYKVTTHATGTVEQHAVVSQNLAAILRTMIDAELAAVVTLRENGDGVA